MSNMFPDSSPSYPLGELHSKLQAGTPHRSKTSTLQSVVRTFNASRTLHQVLGFRDPEPFVLPPAMPSDLRERFEAGLQEYEVSPHKTAENFAGSSAPHRGKTILAAILEEKESPVHPTPTCPTVPGAGGQLNISVPRWTSSKQAIVGAQQYTCLDSDSDALCDAADECTYYEHDVDYYSSWRYGSSTAMAASNTSPSWNSATRDALSSIPAPSFPLRTSSLLPLPYNVVYGSNDHTPLTNGCMNGTLPPDLSSASITPTGIQQPDKQVSGNEHNSPSTSTKTELVPVLFPSPGVEQQSRNVVHARNGYTHSNFSGVIEHHYTFDDTALNCNKDTGSSPAPRITIEAPSPVKSSTSRKRAPSSSGQSDCGPTLSQRARCDGVTGLPVVPLDQEKLWKSDFPGNTHTLLTILLTWSHTMWGFRRQLPDPKLFSIHPAFPYSVTLPVKRQLVSVSFYDTSVEPSKELRFLGPGDVAEMSYHEVDVFDSREGNTDSEVASRSGSSRGTIKQTFKLIDNETPKHFRYMTMSDRAEAGEGRWCYILIKGHEPHYGGITPHLILAWHTGAVTASSDCLHTIYPADTIPKPTAPPQNRKLKRFSSLQNLGAALRSPAKFNFHQSLRSASSSSELPQADEGAEIEQQGSKTLHRTALKMEKGGTIPLIEGFRVDVAAFRGWMDACGKGSGKVIMWRERGGH